MAARPPAAAQSSGTLEVEIADAGGHYRSKTALKTSDKGDRNKVTVACVEALGFSANLADGSRKRSIPLDWRCPGQRSWADTFSVIETADAYDVLLNDATVEKILNLRRGPEAFPAVAKKGDKGTASLASIKVES